MKQFINSLGDVFEKGDKGYWFIKGNGISSFGIVCSETFDLDQGDESENASEVFKSEDDCLKAMAAYAEKNGLKTDNVITSCGLKYSDHLTLKAWESGASLEVKNFDQDWDKATLCTNFNNLSDVNRNWKPRFDEYNYRVVLKTKRFNYRELSVDELIELLPNDAVVGRTEFKDEDKAWMACSYYSACEDYEATIDDWKDYLETDCAYGKTMVDAIHNSIIATYYNGYKGE